MKNETASQNVAKLRPRSNNCLTEHQRQTLARRATLALAVEIDFAQFAQFHELRHEILSLLDTEIKQWAALLGKRALTSLKISQALPLLAPFELTRLTHCFARQFQLDPKASLITLYSTQAELSNENLALLKGLGISAIRLLVDANDLMDLYALGHRITSIQRYGFQDVAIHIEHSDCGGDICDQIKELQSTFKPSYIALGQQKISAESLTSLYEEPVVRDTPTDELHLGPSGVSHFGPLTLRNFCSAEKYQQALRQHCLPIHLID